MAVAESFYPLLQALEVGLRNTIHDAFTQRYGQRWLHPPKLHFDVLQTEAIDKAIGALKEKEKHPDPPRIVAELHFGFWTSLLGRKYENYWHSLLKNAFPGMPGHSRTRKALAVRFDYIRRFRNRVFHHERVVHYNLERIHAEIRETIGWISPELRALAEQIDRFPHVYTLGFEYHRDRLDRLVNA